MSEIANHILTTMDTITLLNWDGVTPIADLKENIKVLVKKATGWDKTHVDFDGSILSIEALDRGDITTILKYDAITGREIYGRVRNCGFTARNLQEIREVLTSR